MTWNLKGNHVDMYYISGNLLRYLSIWVYIGRGSHHPNSSTYVHCKKIVFKNLCLKRNLKTIKKIDDDVLKVITFYLSVLNMYIFLTVSCESERFFLCKKLSDLWWRMGCRVMCYHIIGMRSERHRLDHRQLNRGMAFTRMCSLNIREIYWVLIRILQGTYTNIFNNL